MTDPTQLRVPTAGAASAIRRLDIQKNMLNHLGLLEFVKGGKYEEYNRQALARAMKQVETAQAVANHLATSVMVLRGEVDPDTIRKHFNGTT